MRFCEGCGKRLDIGTKGNLCAECSPGGEIRVDPEKQRRWICSGCDKRLGPNNRTGFCSVCAKRLSHRKHRGRPTVAHIKMRCLKCGREFLSWDKAKNRLCGLCRESNKEIATAQSGAVIGGSVREEILQDLMRV